MTFAILGAVVVTRCPGNVIGWLLLAPGLAVSLPVAELGAAPAETGFLLLAQLWYLNVSWVLVIFPILLMLALFPTGRPLNPRWRWHTWVVVGMGGFFLLLVAALERLGPPDGAGDWTVANPIGFLGDPDAGSVWFGPIWTAGLLAITLGAVASMLVRFRRAGWLERQHHHAVDGGLPRIRRPLRGPRPAGDGPRLVPGRGRLDAAGRGPVQSAAAADAGGARSAFLP